MSLYDDAVAYLALPTNPAIALRLQSCQLVGRGQWVVSCGIGCLRICAVKTAKTMKPRFTSAARRPQSRAQALSRARRSSHFTSAHPAQVFPVGGRGVGETVRQSFRLAGAGAGGAG